MIAKRIGIYGGTFDPIHNGHLRVIVELLSRKVVDEIILIPAGMPRLRAAAPQADGKTRLEMCKLAVGDLPSGIKERVSVSDIEINRAGETYAIDTVEALGNDAQELYWIIGSDAYANIDNWHRADELKELVSFIVIDRPGSKSGENPESRVDPIKRLDIEALDISATEIRSQLNAKEQATSQSERENLGVSPSVRKFIAERKLYAGK